MLISPPATRRVLLAALGVLCLLAGGCARPGYHVRGGAVIYAHQRGSHPVELRVDGAEAATFQGLNLYYGRDAAHVYYGARTIPDCDAATVQVLGDGSLYCRDRAHVFADIRRISDDPDHFELLPFGWSRDGTTVHFMGEPVKGADAVGFALVPNSAFAARDARRVYWKTNAIEGADPASFQALTGEWARDRARGYFAGTPIAGSDGPSFEALSAVHARDKNKVYSDGKVVEGADAQHATALQGAYLKDLRHVYFHDKPVAEADAATFETYEDRGVQARDKNHKFSGPNVVR